MHRAKGRKYRHCQRPIWVDGFISSEKIRESLKVSDWQRAQELVRKWEIESRRPERPLRKSLSACWADFLVDIVARMLHESTIRRYKLLQRQMESYAENRGLVFMKHASFRTSNIGRETRFCSTE